MSRPDVHLASLETLELSDVSSLAREILDEVEIAVVGKRGPLTTVLSGILAGGHVLLEDVPGLGKTLAARSFAQTLGLEFARAQFTPDLLPADLTGSFIFDQRTSEFSFRPGPLFTGLLLADEINRTPPKTQAALLEAMQERHVTSGGKTHTLPQPLFVLATQFLARRGDRVLVRHRRAAAPRGAVEGRQRAIELAVRGAVRPPRAGAAPRLKERGSIPVAGTLEAAGCLVDRALRAGADGDRDVHRHQHGLRLGLGGRAATRRRR